MKKKRIQHFSPNEEGAVRQTCSSTMFISFLIASSHYPPPPKNQAVLNFWERNISTSTLLPFFQLFRGLSACHTAGWNVIAAITEAVALISHTHNLVSQIMLYWTDITFFFCFQRKSSVTLQSRVQKSRSWALESQINLNFKIKWFTVPLSPSGYSEYFWLQAWDPDPS